MPLCRAHPASQHRYYLEDSESAAVLGTPETAPQLEAVTKDLPLLLAEGEMAGDEEVPVLERREDSQPAMMLYTSGTTGPPKGEE